MLKYVAKIECVRQSDSRFLVAFSVNAANDWLKRDESLPMLVFEDGFSCATENENG